MYQRYTERIVYNSGEYRMEVIAMPIRPKVPCRHPGCPELVAAGQRYCARHQPLHRDEMLKPSSGSYGTRWQRVRKKYLAEHPLCVKCAAENPPRYTKATVVDHIVPHRGDPVLFWDPGNWQPLCKNHHDQKTAYEDSRPTYTF